MTGFRIETLDSVPRVAHPGVIWRTCRFRPGAVARIVHPLPGGGGVTVSIPAGLENAVDKRRSEYAAGRLCAALALRRAGAPQTVPRHGRAPVWPPGVRGSISHCGGLAMAVVSRTLPALGVDCERWIAPEMVAEIAPMVLTPADRAACPPDWSVPRFCTVVFSAKEALYKALSSRLPDIPDFHEARVETFGGGALELSFRQWRVRAGYACGTDGCTTLALPG